MFGRKEMDLLLAEKDIRLNEKDAQLRWVVVLSMALVAVAVLLSVYVVKQKERLVEEKEQRLVQAEANATTIRARYQAEWNLRPVLESHVRLWFNKQKLPVPHHGGQEMLNKYKDHGQPDRRHFTDHLDHAMEKNSIELAKKGQVNTKIAHLYYTLSKKHHTGDAPYGLTGFVLNKDANFAAAVSAFFMSLGLSHSVLREDTSSRGCYKLVYKWEPTSEGARSTNDEASEDTSEYGNAATVGNGT